MKCGICGTDKRPNGTTMTDIGDINSHKRLEHPQEFEAARKARKTKREQTVNARRDQDRAENAALAEGRSFLAMPTVIRTVITKGIDNGLAYSVGTTARVPHHYYSLDRGDGIHPEWHGGVQARLLDLEPQAVHTAMQNQIDSLQAEQQILLAAAFKVGPEITLEHLEAVQAAGERAVERLNAEAE